jgi:GntR family transcriptional regulator of arabinose operon
MDDVMPTPMYQKIADELIDRIEKGDLCPGDKLPTETELGGSYSVSRITVTHAIRILQNRGLVYRVKGSGTFVSKRSTSGLAFGNKTANGMSFISVIFPQGEQNGAHDILIGIESECAKGDFYVTIHNSKNKPVLEQSIIVNLLGQGCSGVIIYPCFSTHHNTDIYSELIIRDFPVVFIDRRIDFFHVPFVACDNERPMRNLVAHLIEKGHQRIGFFSNSIETVSSERERFKGYCEAHIAAGLSVKSGLIFCHSRDLENPVDFFDVDEQNRRHYADKALSFFLNAKEKPTCVVAVNDILAIALMKAALAKGIRVPDDLAITGFDDLYVAAHLEVPLTTVRQPFEKIGAEAARLLLCRIKGNANQDAEIRVPAEIVLRESAM